MSFILDALKKSESDRQRQSGPALFEVKVAPPKSRFPVWAIAIAALLVVNMIIVGWMLLRRASRLEDTSAANRPPAATSATTPAAGTAAVPGDNNNPPAAPPLTAGAPSAPPPLNNTPYNSAPPNSASTNSPPSSAPAARQQSGPPSNQQGMGTAQARIPERDQNEPTLAGNTTPAGNAREASDADTDPAANPDDYAPAADPGSPLFKGHVRRGTESGLMLYQDAALVQGSNLPQLRLDLHVYAAKPQERFALINMHKMHEGDSLQGGVRVEAITPDGVVMSHNGSKFLLPRE
jgi:general secretion pathway protein B